jgi:tRNA A58 N-methylase Trm61
MINLIKRIPRALAHRVKIIKEKMKGLDFTRHHMVDELGFSDDIAKAYAPSPEDDLTKILKQLDIQSTDAILDYGSGKGLAMVTMSQFNFSLIAGVELSEPLIEICRKNFSKLGIKNTEVFHYNAMEFKELDRFTHFYLFNPFPEAVLQEVLQNIQASYQKKPRKITFIYYCPRLRDIVNSHPFFEEIKEVKGKKWDAVIFSNEF